MQLSKLYSNREEDFSPIVFNSGERADRLNVILASVKKPKDKNKDSHNLGKTTLIHLLDYCLLKQLNEKHFLLRHVDRFEHFVFYLEIRLCSGDLLTVRRSVADYNKIAFKTHSVPNQNFTSLDERAWDHVDVGIEAAVELLDSYLTLESIKPWTYRQGVSYFMRRQEDYRDVFQIQKFVQ